MLIQRLSKSLLGFDVFVSYSYSDGRQWASSLEEALTRRDLACFLDTQELGYGQQLHDSLRKAIRRSRVLVMVGTEGALTAPYLAFEVEEARRAGKTILPVDVDGIRERVGDLQLREMRWLVADRGPGAPREPTAGFVEEICNHFSFVRRNTLARWSAAAVVSVLVAATGLALWQYQRAQLNRIEAERAGRLAEASERTALARYLADQARRNADTDPERGLLLAVESLQATRAAREPAVPAAEQVLRDLLATVGGTPVPALAGRQWQAFGPRQGEVLTLNRDALLERVDLSSSPPSVAVLPNVTAKAEGWHVSADGQWIATAKDTGMTEVWAVQDMSRPVAVIATHETLPEKLRAPAAAREPDVASSMPQDAVQANAQLQALWETARAESNRLRELQKWLQAHSVHVKLSPDGARLAFLDSDTVLRVWAVSRPHDPPLQLRSGAPGIAAFVFSPDGQRLAIGYWDGTAEVRDLAGRTSIARRSSGRNTRVSELAFSEDGRFLALGGDGSFRSRPGETAMRGSDDKVEVWDLRKDGRVVLRTQISGSAARDFAFSSKGGSFAVAHGAGVDAWDLESTRKLDLPGATAGIASVLFSPDGSWLVTTAGDNRVRAWDLSGPVAVPVVLAGHGASVVAAIFDRGGTLLTRDAAGQARAWDLDHPTSDPLVWRWREGRGGTFAVAAGQGLVAVASSLGIEVWELSSRRRIAHRASDGKGAARALAFSPDGQTLAIGLNKGGIELWPVTATAPLAQRVLQTSAPAGAIAFSAGGRWLAAAAAVDWSPVRMAQDEPKAAGHWLWDLHDARTTMRELGLDSAAATPYQPVQVGFSADERWLAVTRSSGYFPAPAVALWRTDDAVAKNPAYRWHTSADGGTWEDRPTAVSFAFSDRGSTLAVAFAARKVRSAWAMWQLPSQTGPAGSAPQPGGAAASTWPAGAASQPQSTNVAQWLETPTAATAWRRLGQATTNAGSGTLAPASSGVERGDGSEASPAGLGLAFGPGSRWLAVGGRDGAVRLLSRARLDDPAIQLRGHRDAVERLAFDASGRRLASADARGAVRLWHVDPVAGESVLLSDQVGGNVSLTTTADSRWLVIGSTGPVRAYRLDTDELLTKACEVISRNFSCDEWQAVFAGRAYRPTCSSLPSPERCQR